jgi:putative NADPH-quinone reductase
LTKTPNPTSLNAVPKVQKILLVLAAAKEDSKKDKLIVDLCEEFGETCQTQGLEVEWIDLYADYEKDEFDPAGRMHQKDAKIIEYQFRIKRADMIAFFHPVRWNSVPAILKGFLDQVLVHNFAYKSDKNGVEPMLTEKSALIFAFSDNFEWQNKLYYNNTLETFWQRAILEICGLKGQFFSLSGLRSFTEKRIDSIRQKVLKTAKRINSKESWLDLF